MSTADTTAPAAVITARTASIAARIMHLGILFGSGRANPTAAHHMPKGRSVFVEYSGHCGTFRVSFHAEGWEDPRLNGGKVTETWREYIELDREDAEDHAAACLSRLEHALGIVPSFQRIGKAA